VKLGKGISGEGAQTVLNGILGQNVTSSVGQQSQSQNQRQRQGQQDNRSGSSQNQNRRSNNSGR
jgi:hypothetical protein